MARSTAMLVFNVVLLVALVLSVEIMTPTMGDPCTDLIPIKPTWCHGEDVSEDCWDACRKRHGSPVAAECFYETLLPGNGSTCKCYWPC
ncbi:hypothetical protein L1887_05989 [Cichorium endivia]|nr:hypothetical protein L1887_05989 [Cichorium endivia]